MTQGGGGSASRMQQPGPAAQHDKVLIVDFGSQVTQLIARRVREAGVYCEIVPFDKAEAALAALSPRAVILSGGPASITDEGSPKAAPAIFARHLATVHVPRRFYTTLLPGIPTIRVFEALACGIPLLSAPWSDSEGLFTAGRDYLVARDGEAMRECLRDVLNDEQLAASLAAHGRQTVLARHTCAHRVDELLSIYSTLQSNSRKVEATT